MQVCPLFFDGYKLSIYLNNVIKNCEVIRFLKKESL